MPKLKGKSKASSDYVLEKFLQTYKKHCMMSQTGVSLSIKQGIQKCIANDTLITKFVLTSVETASENLHPVSLTPLLRTIRDERYQLGNELCVWGIKILPQDIANLVCKFPAFVVQYELYMQLCPEYFPNDCVKVEFCLQSLMPMGNLYLLQAILLELDGRTIYPFSKLEITHHVLDLWSMERLGIALPYSNLNSLVLDYSKCGDDGVNKLTCGLEGNRKLLTLSLCYCDLGPQSGTTLATLIIQTAICNLLLSGNHLQCLGAAELLKPLAEYAEKFQQEKKMNALVCNSSTPHDTLEANKDANVSSKAVHTDTTSKTNNSTVTALERTGKKKKIKGLKKKSKKYDPGPWLAKLHLADNGIDGRFKQREENMWEFIQLLICLIKNSDYLAEVDIDGNAIGEQCAVKILEALKDRKKEEMARLNIKKTK
ncbi:hypothetical protein JD844_007341 [Phrynosoma platyrhinos]|uniref:Leucine-rich repeat-containing protein 71 n=1 Tax=Phrynosoma platyrhinos TaxID=52577 RepID=A0ABQ7T358_PHRPL|nr:hypothetical protein JD844_007341 [Phrynosoma platyrhinos]